MNNSRRIFLWLLLSFFAGVLCSIAVTITYFSTSPKETPLFLELTSFKPQKMSDCINANLASIKPVKVESVLLKDTIDLCYSQIYREGLLNDFQLRRLKFIQQSYDERILLWMVVAITISGVILAGLQLIASYRLAGSRIENLDQVGELILERNRISLKSSITGLFILLISFAFFLVFVLKIYEIKEVDPDKKINSSTLEAQQLEAGHIEQKNSAKESAVKHPTKGEQ